LLQVDQLPVLVGVDNPNRVGIDRLAAAAAAAHLVNSRPSIVIDAGTAITIDLIQPPNTFCGGAILPGMKLQLTALGAGTEGLPTVSVNVAQPPELIGRNTTAAIQSGVFWGAVGSIREIVARMQDAHSVERVFLTGGAGSALQSHLGIATQMEPDLVLQGIRLARSEADGQEQEGRNEQGQEDG